MNLLSFWQYQIDFLAWILASFAEMIVSIINVRIIFMNVSSVKNWGFYEIMFLMSFIFLARCFWHTFLVNSLDLGYYIRTGNLDYYLVKPIGALFQLMVTGRYNNEFDWEDFFGGVVLLVVSSIKLGLHWSFGKAIILLMVIVSGGLIYSAIVFIASITAFWTTKSFAAVQLLRSGQELSVFPINFYNKPLQYLLIYFVPFAFINYFPANYFLHGTYQMQTLLSPVIGIGMWVIVVLFWSFGLSKYQSTGA
jgi:ABC-2 type transport system permease protein